MLHASDAAPSVLPKQNCTSTILRHSGSKNYVPLFQTWFCYANLVTISYTQKRILNVNIYNKADIPEELHQYFEPAEIGLEDTPEQFVERLVDVFREVRRVLRDDGTLWVNMGDSYAATGKNRTPEQAERNSTLNGGKTSQAQILKQQKKIFPGIGPKNLLGMPWRLAFALQADGWILRQDIIWAKPNPMPESCTDRCTKAHEYIFLLSKKQQYYYDAYSIKTPLTDKTLTTFGTTPKGYGDGSGLIASENWANSLIERKPKKWKQPDGWDTAIGAHGTVHRNGREKGKKEGKDVDAELGANKRSVWTVATAPYKDAHFATFPEALIEPCILAGCPKDGVVLDPFGGAGTTGLVSRRAGRNFILIELNPKYAAMARKRLNKIMKQQQLL